MSLAVMLLKISLEITSKWRYIENRVGINIINLYLYSFLKN